MAVFCERKTTYTQQKPYCKSHFTAVRVVWMSHLAAPLTTGGEREEVAPA